MKQGNSIYYPAFILMASYVDDKFWKSIFNDMAYNVFPRGSYFDKNSLHGGTKGDHFSFPLTDNIEYNVHNITQLLRKKMNIMSSIETLSKKENLEGELKKNYSTWKDIKKKSVKDILIENYVIHTIRTHNLSIKDGQKLLKYLYMQIYFKYIDSNDIVYNAERCRIEYIRTFDFKKILNNI